MARAQQGERMRRIGVLMGLAESDKLGQREAGALRDGLYDLGWIDGRKARIDYRWLSGVAEQARPLARALIALQPDVLVCQGTPVAAAVLQETRVIPLVFVNVADPVGNGLVTNFARPDGNATGFMNLDPSMGGKWVEMLKDLEPHIRRVAFMYNPSTAPLGGRYYGDSFENGAVALAVTPVAAPVHDAADIEQVIKALAGDGGLIVPPDLFVGSNYPLIAELATRNRVAAVGAFRAYPEAGGLLSYGSDSIDIFRRAASYVDRILKSAKPADLPVQAPTKLELVINLKTANAMGLTISREFLLRADEVIE
jgi:putative ABC transport system substrate-binding protein